VTTTLSTDAPIDQHRWARLASKEQTARKLEALITAGFAAELFDDAAGARDRALDLLRDIATVFSGASETLRASGLEEVINTSGRYDAIKPRVWAMDRATQMPEIRRLTATPDFASAA